MVCGGEGADGPLGEGGDGAGPEIAHPAGDDGGRRFFRLTLLSARPQEGGAEPDPLQRLQKVIRVTTELKQESNMTGGAELIEEVADLTYHTLVLLSARGLTPVNVIAELEKRHK